MKVIDRGGGTPVVVIPGIQGRWEWMKPAIDALAQRCRVITFSLADEPSAGVSFDEGRGFWSYVEQVREALDACGIGRAAICGVSYGGLIAAAFAARYPERATSLILVSALPPSWRPDRRVKFYARAPRLLTPIFLLASLRMYREIAAASGGVVRGAGAGIRHAWRVLTHLFSPPLMVRRIGLLTAVDFAAEVTQVAQPTLVITGEPSLDRVVPVPQTIREYAALCPHARFETLANTGHLGIIMRPSAFAQLVVSFADAATHADVPRSRVG
jgi:pimeloyl-ACP methyl ester carboxylesterase